MDIFTYAMSKAYADKQIAQLDLSDYAKKSDISAIADDKMSKSSIVKLDSIEDFENMTETEKTADWYFIKEG